MKSPKVIRIMLPLLAILLSVSFSARAQDQYASVSKWESFDFAGKSITTIEGLAANGQHPLQAAWIAEEVPQCGYCQSGQIMAAAALLAKTAHPTDEEINSFMSANICRCGTYDRIRRAIQRVANGGGAR